MFFVLAEQPTDDTDQQEDADRRSGQIEDRRTASYGTDRRTRGGTFASIAIFAGNPANHAADGGNNENHN